MEEKGDAAARGAAWRGAAGQERRGRCVKGPRRGWRREKGDTTIVERPAAPATSHHGYYHRDTVTHHYQSASRRPPSSRVCPMVHGLGTVHRQPVHHDSGYGFLCMRVYSAYLLRTLAVPASSEETLAFLTLVCSRVHVARLCLSHAGWLARSLSSALVTLVTRSLVTGRDKNPPDVRRYGHRTKGALYYAAPRNGSPERSGRNCVRSGENGAKVANDSY